MKRQRFFITLLATGILASPFAFAQSGGGSAPTGGSDPAAQYRGEAATQGKEQTLQQDDPAAQQANQDPKKAEKERWKKSQQQKTQNNH
jgi:hypothetical protein